VTANLMRRTAAEFLGTFALVTAGCGALVVQATTGALGHLGVAFAFGLVIMVMIAALGHVSGAHFNPAVTVAFAVTRHFPWRTVPVYVAGQLAGAILGAVALRLTLGAQGDLGVTIATGGRAQALAIEAVLTGFLMFVITAVATDTRAVGELAAVAIGGTVALDALWGGPLTGASMNPARSFGPALVAGVWRDHWVYWVGPLAGACVGGALYQLVRSGSASEGEP
jgi:MIP family channel proteins